MAMIRWLRIGAGVLMVLLLADLHAASRAVGRAGSPYLIDVWDTDDGLPQNTITSLLQTRDGFLWLGTFNGLVRFDGVRFEVFDESKTPGLNSSRIVCLFEDRQTNLWVGTETAGVVLIRDGQVTSLGIGAGSAEKRLVSICEDAKGTVWLCLANGELWCYADRRPKPYLYRPLFEPSAYRALAAETDGPIWIGTDHLQSAIAATPDLLPLELPVDQELPVVQLQQLLASRGGGYWRLADGHIQKWRRNRLERDWGAYPWATDPITVAGEDREGHLLVGTRGSGVFWFDGEGHVKWFSTRQGLSHDTVLALLVDREGSLWVGTEGGGLNRVRRQVFEVLDLPEPANAGRVQSVSEDAQTNLWIACPGSGMVHWGRGARRQYGPDQGLTNVNVTCVFVDREQRVWVGTAGGGLLRWDQGRFHPASASEQIPRTIFALYQDRQGNLWLGTQGGLVQGDGRSWRLFTARDGLAADEVHAIIEGRDGELWVGTKGGGLCRLKEGHFTTYRKSDGLPSNDISCLYLDREGVLWVGTYGGGLGRWHQNRWTLYTVREGLLSNSISYVVEDDQGYLWLGSNLGLMRIQKRDLESYAQGPPGRMPLVPVRSYGKPDGLPTRECAQGSQPGALCSRDGRLWFPTVKGLVSVHPRQLNPNPLPPPVVIEAVYVDGQLQNTNSLRIGSHPPLVLRAGRERLEIHYTSLNLSAPDRGRFRYRLEPYESQTTEVVNNRIARYPRLPPGRYQFQVTACNEDGVWNPEGSRLAITVEPPFWRTWWFLLALGLGLLGLVVATVHYLSTQKLQRQVARLRQQEALEQERARIAQDIHDQLGASLTQMALLGELVEADKDQPGDIAIHASQICQTARDTTRVLDEIVWAVNPSNDTLDGLITYLCKHAQDYLTVANLRYRLDVPTQLPEIPLPPEFRHNIFLAFKEAVTNIVRHAGASFVCLRLTLTDSGLVLEIADNGRGMPALSEETARLRNGLRGMRKRMESIGGSFQVRPAPQGGTVVSLTAPLDTSIFS